MRGSGRGQVFELNGLTAAAGSDSGGVLNRLPDGLRAGDDGGKCGQRSEQRCSSTSASQTRRPTTLAVGTWLYARAAATETSAGASCVLALARRPGAGGWMPHSRRPPPTSRRLGEATDAVRDAFVRAQEAIVGAGDGHRLHRESLSPTLTDIRARPLLRRAPRKPSARGWPPSSSRT